MAQAENGSAGKKFLDSVNSMDSDTDIKNVGGIEERAAWGGKIEFILTCIGYAVGLGTVWRFPYLCYKNGGGAFLLPYAIMMCLVGLPLFYMELNMGQFCSQGPLGVYKFSPIFKGLGYTSVMISLLISIYYNVIIAICFYFLFKSMAAELPWADCNNPWNTAACKTLADQTTNTTGAAFMNVTASLSNLTLNDTANITDLTPKTPSEEFFYNHVLQLTDGMGEAGGMRWELAGCLILSWTIVCCVLIRGISSLGKVVYFTALFPYVLLTVLLIRGAMLEGSLNGVLFYLKPQWSKLLEAQVWSDAAVQVFYALSVGSGGLIAMSSYNQFHNNTMRDAFIVVFTTLGTSLWAGFVIFSVLGYMAKIKDVEVADVATQGPGLTFVVYPEALSTMPLPPLWSILFFFMMIILGFSSEFSMMECVLTSLLDEFPYLFKTDRKREIMFRIGTCIFCFFCGLPMVTQGGFYLLNLVDNFAGGFPLIVVGIGELISIQWVYGFTQFSNDTEIMMGKRPPLFFKIALVVIAPALMIAVFAFTIYQYKPLTFQDYVYPPQFSAVGWLIVVTSVGFIPLFATIRCYKKGALQVLKRALLPATTWGPAHAIDRIGTPYERKMTANRSEDTNGAVSPTATTQLMSDMSIPDYEEAAGKL